MKVLSTCLIAAMVLFLLSSPSPGAVYQKDIPMDTGSVLSGPLTDFPVLVKLTPGRVNYAQLQPDGSDLRFYQGATQLAHEIESFDATGNSFIWVKVPNVTSGQSIKMQWGDTGGAPLDPTGVWSNGYIGVYHLAETSGTDIFDSTAGANNGVVVDDPTVDAAGRINGGMTFAGTESCCTGDPLDDSVALGDVFDGLSAMTAEAWMNVAVAPARPFSMPFGKGDVDDAQVGTTWGMMIYDGPGNPNWVHFQINDDENNGVINQRTDDNMLTPGTWQHIAGMWNGGTTGEDLKIFVDGVDESLIPTADGNFVSMNDTVDTIPSVIGAGLVGTRYENFEGDMDEVRFSDVDRSDDWMKASYLSGADNFLGWGDAPGDANGDGVVDDLDLTVLATTWQTAVPEGTGADFVADGFIDDLDLTVLATAWPAGAGLDASIIPEPATLSLLALGGVALLRRNRH